MANPISGGKDFSAEKLGDTGIALTTPYEKSAANNVAIRAGHAVTKTANTREVARAAVTSNYVSAAQIEGFSGQDDASSNYLSDQPIAVMPMIKRPNGNEQILVHPAQVQTRFRLGSRPGHTASSNFIGTACDIYVDPTTGEHMLDPAATAQGHALIIDIYSNHEGKAGGSYYFTVPPAKSSFVG